MAAVELSLNEARVVASLVEKSITTPQYYPMTVNAIMLACNQKTVRSPVMSLSEADVGGALSDLEARNFVQRDPLSGRVTKWRQSFAIQMLLKPQTQALLVTLMLRGPQTASELRANAAGLGGPGESEAFSTAIQDLADRAQPLIVMLPRVTGQKEARYAHTLCGAPATSVPAERPALHAEPRAAADTSALEQRVQALEARVAELEQLLDQRTAPGA
jgi:uncharacterized protein YceH (UPF0502 family)